MSHSLVVYSLWLLVLHIFPLSMFVLTVLQGQCHCGMNYPGIRAKSIVFIHTESMYIEGGPQEGHKIFNLIIDYCQLMISSPISMIDPGVVIGMLYPRVIIRQ